MQQPFRLYDYYTLKKELESIADTGKISTFVDLTDVEINLLEKGGCQVLKFYTTGEPKTHCAINWRRPTNQRGFAHKLLTKTDNWYKVKPQILNFKK